MESTRRRTKSAEQTKILRQFFCFQPRPLKKHIQILSQQTGMDHEEIRRWFRNERSRRKKNPENNLDQPISMFQETNGQSQVQKCLPKTTLWMKSKLAWKKLEDLFEVKEKSHEEKHAEEICTMTTLEKIARNPESQTTPILSLNPRMLNGLRQMFSLHRDYLHELAKDLLTPCSHCNCCHKQEETERKGIQNSAKNDDCAIPVNFDPITYTRIFNAQNFQNFEFQCQQTSSSYLPVLNTEHNTYEISTIHEEQVDQQSQPLPGILSLNYPSTEFHPSQSVSSNDL